MSLGNSAIRCILLCATVLFHSSTPLMADCDGESYKVTYCEGECYCDCGGGQIMGCDIFGSCPNGNGLNCYPHKAGDSGNLSPCAAAKAEANQDADSEACGFWDNFFCDVVSQSLTGGDKQDDKGCCTAQVDVECKESAGESNGATVDRSEIVTISTLQ